jgi:predicted metallopeptidase
VLQNKWFKKREPENVVEELFHSPFPLSGGLQPSNTKRSVWPDRRKLLRGLKLVLVLDLWKDASR